MIRPPSFRAFINDDGNALIELAIGFPVAMLMVFGYINFTLMIFGMCNNAFACRAALRYASIHSNTSTNPTTQAKLNAIVSNFAVAYPTNTSQLTYSYGAGGNTVGQTVNVNVSVTYTLSFMGNTYNPITFNWKTVGLVSQ